MFSSLPGNCLYAQNACYDLRQLTFQTLAQPGETKQHHQGCCEQDKAGVVDTKASMKAAKAEAATLAAATKEAAKAEKALKKQQSSKRWSFRQPAQPPQKAGLKLTEAPQQGTALLASKNDGRQN